MKIHSYKLQNGETRYKFHIYVGVNPLTGKEKATTRSGFKTKKEAKDAFLTLQQEIQNGTYGKVAKDTYRQVYDLWVEHYENTVEDSTFLKTKRIFQNHILPAFGDYRIANIDTAICQKHVNQWAKKLTRFRMVKNYAAVVIKYAMKHGIIDKNPFELVEMPVLKKKISLDDEEEEFENFYTREQLLHFLKCLEGDSNQRRIAIFYLIAFTGMRRGEVFALRWADINFEEHEIRINKAVKRGESGLYLGPTKNGDPRTIKIDEKTLAYLAHWKEVQAKFFKSQGINTNTKKQLVFSNTKNNIQDPHKTAQLLKTFLKKHQLDSITTHGLRHTHCSLLFEAGASIKEVQYRLGHRDVKTTLDIYTHVTKKTKSETINKFTNFLNDTASSDKGATKD